MANITRESMAVLANVEQRVQVSLRGRQLHRRGTIISFVASVRNVNNFGEPVECAAVFNMVGFLLVRVYTVSPNQPLRWKIPNMTMVIVIYNNNNSFHYYLSLQARITIRIPLHVEGLLFNTPNTASRQRLPYRTTEAGIFRRCAHRWKGPMSRVQEWV